MINSNESTKIALDQLYKEYLNPAQSVYISAKNKLTIGDYDTIYARSTNATSMKLLITGPEYYKSITSEGSTISYKFEPAQSGTYYITVTANEGGALPQTEKACVEVGKKGTGNSGTTYTYNGKTITFTGQFTGSSGDPETQSSYKPVTLSIGEQVIDSATIRNGVPVANLGDLAFTLGNIMVGRPEIDDSFEIQYIRPDGGLGIKTYTKSDIISNGDGTYLISILKVAQDLEYGDKTTVVTHSDGTKEIYIDKETENYDLFNSISSMLTGFIPGIGDVKDIQEAVTGYDILTGQKLSTGDRCITIACSFLPIINGAAVRVGKKGVTKIDNVLEAADKLNDVERAAFRTSLWKLKPTIRGILIEEELARTEYKFATTGWYNIGAEMNGYFPVIDFWKGNNVVSLKSIDPRLYYGSGATSKLLDYIEDLKTDILVDGQKIVNSSKKLDIRVPIGTKSQINLQELIDEAEGIIIEIKEF